MKRFLLLILCALGLYSGFVSTCLAGNDNASKEAHVSEIRCTNVVKSFSENQTTELQKVIFEEALRRMEELYNSATSYQKTRLIAALNNFGEYPLPPHLEEINRIPKERRTTKQELELLDYQPTAAFLDRSEAFYFNPEKSDSSHTGRMLLHEFRHAVDLVPTTKNPFTRLVRWFVREIRGQTRVLETAAFREEFRLMRVLWERPESRKTLLKAAHESEQLSEAFFPSVVGRWTARQMVWLDYFDIMHSKFKTQQELQEKFEERFRGTLGSLDEARTISTKLKKVDNALTPLLFANENEYVAFRMSEYRERMQRDIARRVAYLVPIAYLTYQILQ